jgi:hypothetical protein
LNPGAEDAGIRPRVPALLRAVAGVSRPRNSPQVETLPLMHDACELVWGAVKKHIF